MKTKLIFILVSSIFILTSSCKNKKNEQPEVPKAPELDKKFRIPQKSDKTSVNSKISDNKIRPLMPAEDIDCAGACRQLSYCNKKMLGKINSTQQLKICAKTCKSDTTPTGKAKWKSIFKCLKTHRGEDCKGLRKCMEDEMKKLQKEFHNQ